MEFQPDCALGVPGTAQVAWKTEIFLFLTGILQRKQNIYFLTIIPIYCNLINISIYFL